MGHPAEPLNAPRRAPALGARDPRLESIRLKVIDGVRLDRADGLVLEDTHDVAGLFSLADAVRRQRHGRRVTWIANVQCNPTNVCVLRCSFCDFAARPGAPDGYVLDADEEARNAPDGVREVHIVAGLHPKWRAEDYFEYIRAFRRARPEIGVKAFTAVEVEYIARKERTSIADILQRMLDEGVDLLPGGGAEVLSKRIQEALFPHKLGAAEWLDVHEQAHGLGLRSNATLLFGHIETAAERVDHLLALRDLQDRTGGFLSYIPLVYQPGTTLLREHILPPIDRLRQIAIGRLMLDNVPSIKAYWIMMGVETALMALHAGADDLGGTVGKERIAHAAGATSPVGLMRERMERLCAEAGMVAVERDHLYRPLAGSGDARASSGGLA